MRQIQKVLLIFFFTTVCYTLHAWGEPRVYVFCHVPPSQLALRLNARHRSWCIQNSSSCTGSVPVMHLFLMLVVGTVPHGSHKRHNAEGHHLRQEGRGFRSNLRDRIYTYIHRYTRTFIGCASQYPFLCQYLSLSLSVSCVYLTYCISAATSQTARGKGKYSHVPCSSGP